MSKINGWLYWGGKIPRKLKKKFIGTKIGKSKLKILLNSVVIVEEAETMYTRPVIHPYEFCHKCGCVWHVGMGNKSEYPEHWEYFECVRCRTVVGYIDNSAFIHSLECKENNYDPTF